MIELNHIFSFLVRPRSEVGEVADVQGTEVPMAGDLCTMLTTVFLKAESECTIPIRFVNSADGSQENAARGEILELLKNPMLPLASRLAERLQNATLSVSGLGLLFLLLGKKGPESQVVLSRFPANQGILAEASRDQLEVEFVEKVFMKKASSYKAAFYRGLSLKSDFWDGRVVDRQLSNAPNSVANYWVRGFLDSDFRTTSKAGSRLLGIAVRKAAQSTPTVQAKSEIVALATLVPSLEGQSISPNELIARFSLSETAAQQIRSKFPNEHVAEDTFVLDVGEFQKHAAFRMIELDNRGILSAPADVFDDVFQVQRVNPDEGVVRITSQGKIVDERVRTRK